MDAGAWTECVVRGFFILVSSLSLSLQEAAFQFIVTHKSRGRMNMPKKIFVVDDNKGILEMMYELLVPSVNTPDYKLCDMVKILFPSMAEYQQEISG